MNVGSNTNSQAHPGMAVSVHAWQPTGVHLILGLADRNISWRNMLHVFSDSSSSINIDVINKQEWMISIKQQCHQSGLLIFNHSPPHSTKHWPQNHYSECQKTRQHVCELTYITVNIFLCLRKPRTTYSERERWVPPKKKLTVMVRVPVNSSMYWMEHRSHANFDIYLLNFIIPKFSRWSIAPVISGSLSTNKCT